MKLEEGKFYRTRDGGKTGPMIDTGNYFVGGSLHYAIDGECCYLGRTGDTKIVERDIVAEWHDDVEKLLRTAEVNHPAHYTAGGIECYDAMAAMLTREEMIGYLRGNSFKYRWRFRSKGGAEDLHKAEWYEKKLLALIETP